MSEKMTKRVLLSSARTFEQLWLLLDSVAEQAGDTLWYSDFITAHERLIDIAYDYDPGIAKMLQDKMRASRWR